MIDGKGTADPFPRPLLGWWLVDVASGSSSQATRCANISTPIRQWGSGGARRIQVSMETDVSFSTRYHVERDFHGVHAVSARFDAAVLGKLIEAVMLEAGYPLADRSRDDG